MKINIRLPKRASDETCRAVESELRERLIVRYPDSKAHINSADIKACGTDTARVDIIASDVPGQYEGLDIVLKTAVALVGNNCNGQLKEEGTDYITTFKPFAPA